jgi:hypothetical protein
MRQSFISWLERHWVLTAFFLSVLGACTAYYFDTRDACRTIAEHKVEDDERDTRQFRVIAELKAEQLLEQERITVMRADQLEMKQDIKTLLRRVPANHEP